MEITSNDLKRTSRHGTNGTSIKKDSHFPTFVSFFAQHADFRSGVLWYLWDGLRWCISEAFPAFEIIHQMAVSKPLSTGCVWGLPTDMAPFIGIIRDNDDRCSQWIFQGPLFSLKPRWIPNMVYITFHTYIGWCPKISFLFCFEVTFTPSVFRDVCISKNKLATWMI